MLGELIAELQGNRTGIWVLDIEGTVEVSVSLSGKMRGTPVNEFTAYMNRGTNTQGAFSGKGQGIVMVEESKVATFTGEGFGGVDSSGSMKWRAANNINRQIGVSKQSW